MTTVDVHCDIETDLILLREAEAEQLWAALSMDLCQARSAAAIIRAIRARMQGRG
jgi:hypothetical protein